MKFKNAKVLIIGSVWPEPNSTAAGNRMMELTEFFLSLGSEITFASASSESEFAIDFTKYSIRKEKIKLNDSSFNWFVLELQPQIVLFDRFMIEEQYGWRVSESCPSAIKILDTEDLHCLRYARQQAWKENREFDLTDLYAEDIAKREIASVLRCDLSLIISEYEMEILTSHFNISASLLMYLPFMLNKLEDNEIKKFPSFGERQHFITIGNFLHQPNWQSVLYLKNEIWPLIHKQLPEAEMHVYGAYASEKVMQLHQPKTNFFIKGRAAVVKPVMQNAKICLAPLQFGAGLKGKLIDAMQYGTPNVTTSIGAEAIHQNLPWSGEIENEPESFANAAVDLYTNEEKWAKAQQNGFKIIDTVFDKEKHTSLLQTRIENLMLDLNGHRKHNFLGAMLQHHSMASSKYLSKWIEEKNKN